jgi:cell division transport system permease protein
VPNLIMNIHLKSTFSNIRRSPFQALAAVSVLALTFFVATMVAVTAVSCRNLLHYFATRPQIIAFLKSDASQQDIGSLQSKLLNNSKLKNLKYVSKEEALKIYKDATSDNPLLSELVSPSVFPASLEFSVTDISYAQTIIDETKKESIVDSVGFTASLGGEKSLSDVISRLKTVTSYVEIGGGIFVGVLGVTSFFVILVIVSIRMLSRRSEVEVLKLIGATPGFIGSPLMLEAVFYCLMGVLLGWLAAFVIWLYLTPSIVSYFGEIAVLPKDFLAFFLMFVKFLLAELGIALVLAISGSQLALSRTRKLR